MNTIRELKQQEKYKNMLKRKNKEKKIYKDKNASLQFEKQKLYIALLNREKEIERLNNNIDKAIEYMNEVLECNYHGGNVTFDDLVHNTEHILRGADKE